MKLCIQTRKEQKNLMGFTFAMVQLPSLCALGQEVVQKEPRILGWYIIGGRGDLALGQGATVKREEVCMYMYVLMYLFAGVRGSRSLHWHQSSRHISA